MVSATASIPATDIRLSPATIDGQPVEPTRRVDPGGWLRVSYLRDGLGHDPDDGRPAVVVYRPDGSVALVEHRRAGRLHDPDDGRPAYEERAGDGSVSFSEHYRDGTSIAERSGPLLIGVGGYARSGKDTTAAGLVERHGYRRLAFADKLKQVAYDLDPIIDIDGSRLALTVDTQGWEAAKARPEVRRLLQALGESGRKRIGPDVWVDAVMAEVDASPTVPTVISDVRYPNELAAIRRRGGMYVRVTRPGVGPANGHESETAIADIAPDAAITNDGSIEDLQDAITNLIGGHRRG